MGSYVSRCGCVCQGLLCRVLFDFDFFILKLVDYLEKLFEFHVEVLLDVFVPSRMQVAQGVIDYKI